MLIILQNRKIYAKHIEESQFGKEHSYILNSKETLWLCDHSH